MDDFDPMDPADVRPEDWDVDDDEGGWATHRDRDDLWDEADDFEQPAPTTIPVPPPAEGQPDA